MGHDTFTRDAFRKVKEETESLGGPSVTERGQQRHREGKGLDPLVDPRGFGVIRRSISRKDQDGRYFRLNVGIAMLVEVLFDTTGSMGNNVDIAFNVLPDTFDLLAVVPGAPLARYDPQIINAIFGDRVDDYILCRSQAEMGAKIAEELTMMVPEKGGGDYLEDPQYGLFAAAYLTAAEIRALGLKSYHFTITDAPAHGDIDLEDLIRVFGPEVLDRVIENGFQMGAKNLPQIKQIVKDLLITTHAFVLSVGGENRHYWEKLYGRERVVTLPRTQLLPQIQAAIIGLTEGTITLQNLAEHLEKHAKINAPDAEKIRRAVAGIPIGAQAALPNFGKIPLRGALFANKTDLWPMADEDVEVEAPSGESEQDMWK